MPGDEEIQMALHGEKEFDTGFRVLWPDGTIRNIRALGIVQWDASGKPLRMIGTNWDITESKEAENKVNEQLDELQRWYDATSGRESRILELKAEVNAALTQAGKHQRYESVI